LIVSAPMNEAELRNLMFTAQLPSTELPMVIRYPRGEGVMPEWRTPLQEITIGTGRKLKDGDTVAILTIGHPGNFAAAAIRDLKAEGLNPAHYETMLHEVFGKFNKVITIEDGTVVGGFGSAVLEFMAANDYTAQVKILGIPDRLVEHGTPKQLYSEIGIDAEHIAEAVRQLAGVTTTVGALLQ
jgi:1-deoxy-D-xylulose-5-phosphate synthase